MKIRILSLLWLFLFFSHAVNAQELRQLTQNELNSELRKALDRNDEAGITGLIKDHRLYIKPFIQALVKESIRLELNGKTGESERVRIMAEYAARIFNEFFGFCPQFINIPNLILYQQLIIPVYQHQEYVAFLNIFFFLLLLFGYRRELS